MRKENKREQIKETKKGVLFRGVRAWFMRDMTHKKAIFPVRVIPNQVPPARMSMPERMLGWELGEKEWKWAGVVGRSRYSSRLVQSTLCVNCLSMGRDNVCEQDVQGVVWVGERVETYAHSWLDYDRRLRSVVAL